MRDMILGLLALTIAFIGAAITVAIYRNTAAIQSLALTCTEVP